MDLRYDELVSLNAKSKELDWGNERIKAQIKEIYQKWAFLTQLSIQDIEKDNIPNLELNIVDNENGFHKSLNSYLLLSI